MSRSWCMTEEIGDTRRGRCNSRPTIDFSKRNRSQRPPVALIVVRKKLRFVGSHVDVRGALGFARFTRETQIERFFDVLVLPAAAQHFALQQFEEKMRAATRTVLLFSRGHVTWAHGAAIALSAGSKPNPPQVGVCEQPAPTGQLHIVLPFPRP